MRLFDSMGFSFELKEKEATFKGGNVDGSYYYYYYYGKSRFVFFFLSCFVSLLLLLFLLIVVGGKKRLCPQQSQNPDLLMNEILFLL